MGVDVGGVAQAIVSGGGILYVPFQEGQLNFLIECVVFNAGCCSVTAVNSKGTIQEYSVACLL